MVVICLLISVTFSSHFVIMDTLKIRVIMEYDGSRGSNAAQAARNINDVYGANTTNNAPPVIGLLASVLGIST